MPARRGDLDRSAYPHVRPVLPPLSYHTVREALAPVDGRVTRTPRRSVDESKFMVDWELPPPVYDR